MMNVPYRITTGEMPPMRLRRARTSDVPRLDKLIEKSLRSLGAGYYTPEQIESALQYAVRIDPQLVEDGTFYVVEYGRQLMACGAWSKRGAMYRGDQNNPTNDLIDPALHPAKARSFYVHPDWTRRGLGSWLMAECAAAAKTAGFHQIELMATRMGVPLYSRFGYRIVEEPEIEFPNGVRFPVTRMLKALD